MFKGFHFKSQRNANSLDESQFRELCASFKPQNPLQRQWNFALTRKRHLFRTLNCHIQYVPLVDLIFTASLYKERERKVLIKLSNIILIIIAHLKRLNIKRQQNYENECEEIRIEIGNYGERDEMMVMLKSINKECKLRWEWEKWKKYAWWAVDEQ